MNTLTMARIYERQGYLEDALAIYIKLLKDEPKNQELQRSIQRIKGRYGQKVSYFINMKSREQFELFEKWLVKPWS